MRMRRTARAMAATSFGGTSRASHPCVQIEGKAPTLVDTTHNPRAAASITETPKLSYAVVLRKMSPLASCRASCGRETAPGRWSRAATPSSAASRSVSSRLPSPRSGPIIVRVVSGNSSVSEARTRTARLGLYLRWKARSHIRRGFGHRRSLKAKAERSSALGSRMISPRNGRRESRR